MNKHVTIPFLAALFSSMAPFMCYGHNEPVHMAITQSAALSSDRLRLFVQDHLGAKHGALTTPKLRANPAPAPFAGFDLSPINWLMTGSYFEDDGARPLNHFYTVDVRTTPKAIYGLNDHLGWFPLLPGIRDSFTWGSVRGNTFVGINNVQSWQNARDYLYAALTLPATADREKNLATALYALGHVLHLNQDLSQPEHTRNDQHATRAFIEDYGLNTYYRKPGVFPLRPRGWPSWRDAGFNKLKDFWDRNLYLGQAQALVNDASGAPGNQLGLAEFSSGNFLGADARYREEIPFADQHYYPFPSLLTGTTYPQARNNIRSSVRPVTYPNGALAKRVFLRKIGDGVPVENHSALTWLGVMFRKGKTLDFASTTIDDPKILDDYHSIVIPKAIEYSAGILDYFFRGRLEIGIDPIQPPVGSTYRIRISNVSGQPLQGGIFKLFADTGSGRLPVPLTTTYGGSLADNGLITGDFVPPVEPSSSYVVVYQGTIGVNGSTALDPIDAGIAIAAQRFIFFPWTFTDSGFIAGGQNGATRTYKQPASVMASPWVMQPNPSLTRISLRLNFENDHNCATYNNKIQSGTAVGRLNPVKFFGGPVRISIEWTGLGEREAMGYELMRLSIDNTEVGRAHAPGGALGCAGGVGPVVSSPAPPQFRDLVQDRDYEIQINASTFDALYHVGAYYQFDLRFDPLP